MIYPFFSGLEYLYGLNRTGDRFRNRTATPGFGSDGPLTAYGDGDGDGSDIPRSSTSLPGFSGFGGFLGGPDPDDSGGGIGSAATRPWDIADETDSRDPFAPDRDSLRRARGRGLLAAGIGLLEGAGTGDLTGGIARGFAGFTQARDQSLDRDRSLALQAIEERRRDAAERRAESAEGRAASQESDRDRMADVQYDAANEELDAYRDAQDRGRQLRSATGKSADRMVAEIAALAAANPEDETLQRMAKRAIGYSLGEDSDLNKLAVLHAEMSARLGRDSDADWEREQSITTAKAQSQHGYGPIAEGSRSERGLSMEERRLDLYGQQVAHQGERTDRWAPTPGQQIDDIRQEADKVYSSWLQGRMKGVGELVLGSFNPDGSPVRKQPPSAEEIARARADALAAAQKSYEAQLQSLRGPVAGLPETPTDRPTTTPRVLHYDPRTGSLRPPTIILGGGA